jgi:hypothetical protein
MNFKNRLFWIVILAFAVRLLVGVSLHLGLPLHGHADEDDQAGYVFTDARIRDEQAWNLASSDHPIWDAFSRKFSFHADVLNMPAGGGVHLSQ